MCGLTLQTVDLLCADIRQARRCGPASRPGHARQKTAALQQRSHALVVRCSSTAYTDTIERAGSDRGISQQVEDRVGVLLLNLGGPETLADVQPFLYNLFVDESIIRLPPQGVASLIDCLPTGRHTPFSTKEPRFCCQLPHYKKVLRLQLASCSAL